MKTAVVMVVNGRASTVRTKDTSLLQLCYNLGELPFPLFLSILSSKAGRRAFLLNDSKFNQLKRFDFFVSRKF